jgi:hypothetical protein
MTTSLQARDRREERKRFVKMAGAGAGTAGLFLLGFPILGTAALVGAGYFAYDWFMFRAKRGMRF